MIHMDMDGSCVVILAGELAPVCVWVRKMFYKQIWWFLAIGNPQKWLVYYSKWLIWNDLRVPLLEKQQYAHKSLVIDI